MQTGARLQFHWSGQAGERVYIHEPDIISPWGIVAIALLGPGLILLLIPFCKRCFLAIEAWERRMYAQNQSKD